MHWRQKEWEQPSLIAPPSEPQTSMHTAQSCLLPPTVRGHHGLCCILDFFLRRCGVPVPRSKDAQASASSLSGGSSQRQAVPQDPVSLGQSAAWSRAGRPYRPCYLHSAAPLFPRLPGVAALLVFLSLGVVLSTEALLRSTGANAERAEDRVLRRCIGARRGLGRDHG